MITISKTDIKKNKKKFLFVNKESAGRNNLFVYLAQTRDKLD
jgi:hypothetical protein